MSATTTLPLVTASLILGQNERPRKAALSIDPPKTAPHVHRTPCPMQVDRAVCPGGPCASSFQEVYRLVTPCSSTRCLVWKLLHHPFEGNAYEGTRKPASCNPHRQCVVESWPLHAAVPRSAVAWRQRRVARPPHQCMRRNFTFWEILSACCMCPLTKPTMSTASR